MTPAEIFAYAYVKVLCSRIGFLIPKGDPDADSAGLDFDAFPQFFAALQCPDGSIYFGVAGKILYMHYVEDSESEDEDVFDLSYGMKTAPLGRGYNLKLNFAEDIRMIRSLM
jgi:hypothetical protein